ncbi:MAG: type II toxin-antitoxin system RelE/ParE family toxin [Clostridia bacterium]|nr:type II toxin-antitoxin system RelE/ParE family toxin [Clostridia bacterium]
MQKYELVYYELPSGKSPVREFINSQDAKMKAKIQDMEDTLAQKGPKLRMPLSRFLGEGIFELRIQVGNRRTRVLYFFCKGNKIVLTNGFVKKTQKTPVSEINKAKKYRDDFERRNQE